MICRPCLAAFALLVALAAPARAQQPAPRPADAPGQPAATPGPPAASPAGDQPVPPEIARRPKVGLVLSGGGARGAAHVGVLRVLKELRIPIDYIAGTSMGAIVGGLYASGLSVDELQEVVDTTDWFDVFNDSSRRQYLSFRRKQDDARVLSPIRIGIEKGKPALPPGLITGQNVTILMHELTLPSAGIERFDDLPIPFRAVATDLVTGEKVVLDRGSLSLAMRASMSVPGAFTPVEIDGRRLLDGGLVANLPIDVARQMGAEVVIAVDISTPLATSDQIRTLLNVAGQMNGFQTRKNVLEQIATLGPQDILIVPELEGISAGSFERERMTAAILDGEAAAREHATALERLAVSPADYAAYQQRRFRNTTRVVQVRNVTIENNSHLDDRVLLDRLRVEPDSPLDIMVLNADLARLYELDAFELVDFRLMPIEGEKDRFDLVIKANTKTWGRHFLRVGLNLVSNLTGYGEFTALASYTMTELNGLGAEWRTTVGVGTRPLVDTEFYQPLDYRGRWFFAPYGGWRREPYPLTAANGAELEFRVDRGTAGIDFGRQFGRWAELRLGAFASRRDAKLETLGIVPFKISSDPIGARLRFEWDTLDSVNFPRSGWRALLDSEFAYKGGINDESFETASLRAGGAISFGNNTFSPSVFLGWAGGSPTVFDQYAFGGLFNLSGYGLQRYFGTEAALAKLAYYRRLLELPPQLGSGIFAGLAVEGAYSRDPVAGVPTDGWKGAAAAYLGADTLIGPLYLAYGISSDGVDSFYLFLGRLF